MRLLSAAAVTILVTVTVVAQGPRRDGNWEVTMTMDMPGMPQGMNMPPFKTTQCITPEEAKDPNKTIPQRPAGRGGASNPNDCKVSDYKEEGNRITWSMKCEGAQPMSGTGEFVYAGDSYTGTMKMDMAGAATVVNATCRPTGIGHLWRSPNLRQIEWLHNYGLDLDVERLQRQRRFGRDGDDQFHRRRWFGAGKKRSRHTRFGRGKQLHRRDDR